MDVLLIHGYNVTSTRTYGVLPQRLKAAGHRIRNVYLSKYVTLDNELTLDDIVRAFQAALVDIYGASLGKTKFACVTHSTGGLVARRWISAYYENRMGACPLSHLIMLAPPNHGSRLAIVGRSRVSRLRSLWGTDPGVKILDALETGSSFQWSLNSRWIGQKTSEAKGFFPFVIAGQWIDKKLWDVIVPATYERGSDGVVRAASTNLNVLKIVWNGRVTQSAMDGLAYLITPRTSHSDERFGIMGSVPAKGDHPVLTAILEALDVHDNAAYKKLTVEFEQRTADVQKTETYHDKSELHRYSQLVVRVVDQTGAPLTDYAVELIDHEGRGDRFPSGFMAHSHQNAVTPELYTYYLDYDRISKVIGGKVGVRVQSTPASPLVAYEQAQFLGPAVDEFLFPNRTTYLEMVLHRRLNKNVFRLTKNTSYQKIDRTAGPDWID